jgi:hypothetical protein
MKPARLGLRRNGAGLILCLALFLPAPGMAAEDSTPEVGIAVRDITPELPIRLAVCALLLVLSPGGLAAAGVDYAGSRHAELL